MAVCREARRISRRNADLYFLPLPHGQGLLRPVGIMVLPETKHPARASRHAGWVRTIRTFTASIASGSVPRPTPGRPRHPPVQPPPRPRLHRPNTAYPPPARHPDRTRHDVRRPRCPGQRLSRRLRQGCGMIYPHRSPQQHEKRSRKSLRGLRWCPRADADRFYPHGMEHTTPFQDGFRAVPELQRISPLLSAAR